jgi:hypothetical protein
MFSSERTFPEENSLVSKKVIIFLNISPAQLAPETPFISLPSLFPTQTPMR